MTAAVQLIVDVVNVIYSTLNKELYNDVALTTVGKGISGSFQ